MVSETDVRWLTGIDRVGGGGIVSIHADMFFLNILAFALNLTAFVAAESRGGKGSVPLLWIGLVTLAVTGVLAVAE